VKLYDGSFEEWPNLDESLYPVEQTPASDKP
jgi:3-mercaptopyruvate sulfurtransferase SseA